MPTFQAMLKQGTTDFSPYVEYNGVEQSYLERAAKNVVTMDGTLCKAAIKKRVISVKLIDMTHEALTALFSDVAALAAWTYLDADSGLRTANFYLSGPTVGQRLARGGLTQCTGISFTLEEK